MELDVFYFEDVVGDVGVIDADAFVALDVLDNLCGEGQDDDFVEGLGGDLEDHHLDEFAGWHESAEREGEEDEGVGSFAYKGGEDGAEGEASLLMAEFHAAHHPGVKETSDEEGGEAGCGDARCESEDELEGLFSFPEGWGGDDGGDGAEGDDEEVHEESHPDDEPGFAESPDLGDAVVEDVGDGEDDDAGCEGEGADLEDFCPEQVGSYETDTKKYPHQHEGYAYSTVCFHCCSCFLRG